MPTEAIPPASGLPEPAAIIVACDQAIASAFPAVSLFAAPVPVTPVEEREANLIEGRILLDPALWPVSQPAADRILQMVCAAWSQIGTAAGTREDGDHLNPGALDAAAIVRDVLLGQAMAGDDQTHGLPLGLIRLLMARPFLRSAATLLVSGVDLKIWGRGFCPVCGHAPALAMLDGETRARRLWCQWCDTQWPFRRVCCVFCGNTDQDRLRHYETDPPDGLRVDVCDRCRGYLKTMVNAQPDDNQQGALLRSELSSGLLDEAAAARGYRRPDARPQGGEDVLA